MDIYSRQEQDGIRIRGTLISDLISVVTPLSMQKQLGREKVGCGKREMAQAGREVSA